MPAAGTPPGGSSPDSRLVSRFIEWRTDMPTDAAELKDTSWLFTRGDQSVRMLRLSDAAGGMHLIVHGPGGAAMVHHTDDLVESMLYQANLGRDLLARGFDLNDASSDRRKGRDRRKAARDGPDRRRRHVAPSARGSPENQPGACP